MTVFDTVVINETRFLWHMDTMDLGSHPASFYNKMLLDGQGILTISSSYPFYGHFESDMQVFHHPQESIHYTWIGQLGAMKNRTTDNAELRLASPELKLFSEDLTVDFIHNDTALGVLFDSETWVDSFGDFIQVKVGMMLLEHHLDFEVGLQPVTQFAFGTSFNFTEEFL